MTRKVNTKTITKPFDFSEMQPHKFQKFYIIKLQPNGRTAVKLKYTGIYCSRLWNKALGIYKSQLKQGIKEPFSPQHLFNQYFKCRYCHSICARTLKDGVSSCGSMTDLVPKSIFMYTLSDLAVSCRTAFRSRNEWQMPLPIDNSRDRFRLGNKIQLDLASKKVLLPNSEKVSFTEILHQSPIRRGWFPVSTIDGEVKRAAIFRQDDQWLLGIVTKKAVNTGDIARKQFKKQESKQSLVFDHTVGSFVDRRWITKQRDEQQSSNGDKQS